MMPHCLKQYGMESIATPMMELANVIIDLSDIFNYLGTTFSSVNQSASKDFMIHLKTDIASLHWVVGEQVEINDY